MRGFSSFTTSFNNIQAVQFKLISQVCDVQWLWTYHLHYLSCQQLWTNLQKHLLSGWGHHHHHHFVVCPEFANKSSFFWHLCPPLWMIMLPQAIFVSKRIKINKLMLITSILGQDSKWCYFQLREILTLDSCMVIWWLSKGKNTIVVIATTDNFFLIPVKWHLKPKLHYFPYPWALVRILIMPFPASSWLLQIIISKTIDLFIRQLD